MGRLKMQKDDNDVASKYLPVRPGLPECIYARTGECPYGVSCKFNHTASATAEESIGRLKIQKDDNDVVRVGAHPNRSGQPNCITFTRMGHCPYGGLCRFNHIARATVEESTGRLKIQKVYNELEPICALPYRSGQPDCVIYARTGHCPYGLRCKFNHVASTEKNVLYLGGPERLGVSDCQFYVRRGICSYGPKCRFHHPPDRNGVGPLLFNSLDLPIRQGETSCDFYLQNGYCKFGVLCRYDHPEPPTTGSSSATPSTGWHSAESSNSDQHSQHVETSMPLVISPSQGLAPTYGWNSYLGYMNPMSYASVRGPIVIYNPYPGALNYTSPVNLFPASFFNHLPERPDQPECWDFMNTGTCYYGSVCKYNHPRERKAQTETYLVAPLGLPLRPVRALSSPLSLYGFCKYGLTWRYDRPSVGYFYINGLTSASVNGFGQSSSVGGFGQSFLYQKGSPSFHLKEMLSEPASVTVTVRKPEVAIGKKQNLDSGTLEASKEQSSHTVEPAKDESA